MSLIRFLNELQENGRVHVNIKPDVSESVLAAFDASLRNYEHMYRLELPGDAPDYIPIVGRWAGLLLYQVSQFLVFREIGAEIVEAALRKPCPMPRSPAVCYSADLMLRFIPDCHSLARGFAQDDPLVGNLRTLAAQWPLSSVGIKELGPLDCGAFIDNRCLRAMYVDRILERKDTSRLSDERTCDAVRSALGAYSELCPEISSHLENNVPAVSQPALQPGEL